MTRDLTTESASAILAEINWRRSEIKMAKTDVEQTHHQLRLDELLEELDRRNVAEIERRAAAGKALRDEVDAIAGKK